MYRLLLLALLMYSLGACREDSDVAEPRDGGSVVSLAGYVLDEKGDPFPNARVSVWEEGDVPNSASIYIDADGQFHLCDILVQTPTLRVYVGREGFMPSALHLDYREGVRNTVIARLLNGDDATAVGSGDDVLVLEDSLSIELEAPAYTRDLAPYDGPVAIALRALDTSRSHIESVPQPFAVGSGHLLIPSTLYYVGARDPEGTHVQLDTGSTFALTTGASGALYGYSVETGYWEPVPQEGLTHRARQFGYFATGTTVAASRVRARLPGHRGDSPDRSIVTITGTTDDGLRFFQSAAPDGDGRFVLTVPDMLRARIAYGSTACDAGTYDLLGDDLDRDLGDIPYRPPGALPPMKSYHVAHGTVTDCRGGQLTDATRIEYDYGRANSWVPVSEGGFLLRLERCVEAPIRLRAVTQAGERSAEVFYGRIGALIGRTLALQTCATSTEAPRGRIIIDYVGASPTDTLDIARI